MVCVNRAPTYANVNAQGLNIVGSAGDGYSMILNWNQAYSDSMGFSVAYNIYFADSIDSVFSEGPKFVVPSANVLSTTLSGFTPGDNYWFSVKATEYDSRFINLALLPDGAPDAPTGVKVYPSGILLANISATDTLVPISDINIFPPYGVVKIGYELLRYSAVDLMDGYLIVVERGVYTSRALPHNTDGYDGYDITSDVVQFFTGFEDAQNIIFQSENKFSYPHEVWNATDGYRENNSDFITTDYTASDDNSATLRRYDYSGWHRTDPVDIINGTCVGSYIGGEFYCADGYLGAGVQVRGLSVQEQNNQRQEVLLSTTGSRCVLVKRMWEGKRCHCVDSTRETPEQRCPRCFGTGYVSGYDQYFNNRESDGCILVRFSPFVEDLDHQEPGLESKVTADCWTTVAPSLKDRDFIIRLNKDGTEEWRYEILNVTKNNTFVELLGMQKFSVQRVRKTDPIAMVPVLRDSATMPTHIYTSINGVLGPGGIPPHMHQVVISLDNTTSINQINQLTSIIQGHNHVIRNGIILATLGHTHSVII